MYIQLYYMYECIHIYNIKGIFYIDITSADLLIPRALFGSPQTYPS